MKNPDPVPPPVNDRVWMETTEGKTRCAVPATESGALSIVLVEDTRFTRLKIEAPDALTPKIPPAAPAKTAINATLPLEVFDAVFACHQGAATGEDFLRGKIMAVFCYNFVAINNPSPTGSKELTQWSVSFLMIFPASRSATVRGSRWAASHTLPPP